MMTLSQSEWVKLSQPLNIDDVWSNYKSSIKAFLMSRISNRDDVDDLLQMILIKAYRNLATVQSEGSLQSWLFQISNRTIIDYYRSEKSVEGLSEKDLWFGGEKERTVFDDFSHCIEPFFNALPEKSATLLRAINLEGQSQKSVARQQGIAYSTLKSRVQKGREQLRALFENCCHMKRDTLGNIVEYEARSLDIDCCD